jgi:hypothetical protein
MSGQSYTTTTRCCLIERYRAFADLYKYIIARIEFLKNYGAEYFAETRGEGSQKRRRGFRETNEYQRTLASLYEEWVEMASEQLAEADEDERDALIASLVLLFATQMKAAGRENILNAMYIGGGTPTPELLQRTVERIRDNESYIDNSLSPDLAERLRRAVRDPDVMATGAFAIAGIMWGMQARVESYAGAMWAEIQDSIGEVSKQAEDHRIFWALEPRAQHCDDCLEYGNREYESYEMMLAMTGGAIPGSGVQCNGNCRCRLEYVVAGEFVGV